MRLGYPGLLNLEKQPHRTIFLTDFSLPSADKALLRKQLRDSSTRPVFIRIDRGLKTVRRSLKEANVDWRCDYLSLHGLTSRYESVQLLHELFRSLPRRDLARFELPLRESGFQPAFATKLLEVVTKADYHEQDQISRFFFTKLSSTTPYHVTVNTSGGTLQIVDQRSWFALGGKLREGEQRILPGGEVAYTGACISGTFTADGAILATPQAPPAAAEAARIGKLSRELGHHPIEFRVKDGRVIDVRGAGRTSKLIAGLLEKDQRYQQVTEVGISFNRACRKFVHRWPAASNEGRPGVHMAIGGDPDPDEATSQAPLVHIDFMAANCEVFVNDHPFLRASS